MHRPLGAADVVITYEFKLYDCRGTSLSLNEAKGHDSRVVINANCMAVRKAGHDHDGPDKAALLQDLKIDIRHPGRRVAHAGPRGRWLRDGRTRDGKQSRWARTKRSVRRRRTST